MSVEELCARIDKLSSEMIDLQESPVKKLKEDRSLVQRQLNAAIDPVSRLPVEISSEIFMQSLAPFPEPGARHTPMLLLHICHAWSAIALSTPDLWASIQISFPCATGFSKVLPLWLQRAHTCPLSISLCGDLGNVEPQVLSIIWQHGRQLKHLEIADEFVSDDDVVDFFGGTIPGPLPLLETVTIRGLPVVGTRSFRAVQFFELLRSASNIVECVFDRMYLLYGIDDIPELLVLPTLRRWMFGDGQKPTIDAEILSDISLPGLEALSVSLLGFSSSHLFSFLKRSAPPLQELVLVLGYEFMDPLSFHECFGLIPTLTWITIHWAGSEGLADSVTVLADTPSLLPNLQRLDVHVEFLSDFPDSFWRTLLRVPLTRGIQFEFFGVSEPPADILAAFRKLAADGMQVHVGTIPRNFIA
ncbi:F-box domain-containing protein [Mycena venus]|uniref:F-box domain-containing protein n=1 Tax=Mycena venus TaxID=2733690 RepID=A0A8H6WUH1_9AGAR|nr:F-box domain-containing protein [Mycena venus]